MTRESGIDGGDGMTKYGQYFRTSIGACWSLDASWMHSPPRRQMETVPTPYTGRNYVRGVFVEGREVNMTMTNDA